MVGKHGMKLNLAGLKDGRGSPVPKDGMTLRERTVVRGLEAAISNAELSDVGWLSNGDQYGDELEALRELDSDPSSCPDTPRSPLVPHVRPSHTGGSSSPASGSCTPVSSAMASPGEAELDEVEQLLAMDDYAEGEMLLVEGQAVKLNQDVEAALAQAEAQTRAQFTTWEVDWGCNVMEMASGSAGGSPMVKHRTQRWTVFSVNAGAMERMLTETEYFEEMFNDSISNATAEESSWLGGGDESLLDASPSRWDLPTLKQFERAEASASGGSVLFEDIDDNVSLEIGNEYESTWLSSEENSPESTPLARVFNRDECLFSLTSGLQILSLNGDNSGREPPEVLVVDSDEADSSAPSSPGCNLRHLADVPAVTSHILEDIDTSGDTTDDKSMPSCEDPAARSEPAAAGPNSDPIGRGDSNSGGAGDPGRAAPKGADTSLPRRGLRLPSTRQELAVRSNTKPSSSENKATVAKPSGQRTLPYSASSRSGLKQPSTFHGKPCSEAGRPILRSLN